jgi:hypothetical protein
MIKFPNDHRFNPAGRDAPRPQHRSGIGSSALKDISYADLRRTRINGRSQAVGCDASNSAPRIFDKGVSPAT